LQHRHFRPHHSDELHAHLLAPAAAIDELAIIEIRRNLDALPAGASSGKIVCGAEARRMG